jgi:hypothetical protein
MAGPSPFESQYFFTLAADVSAKPVGETPTGYRVDVQYQTPGEVNTDPNKYYDAWVKAKRADVEKLLNQADFPPDLQAPGKETQEAKEKRQAAAVANAVFKLRRAAKAGASSKVVEAAKSLANLISWLGFDGEILSGSDWAIIRSDGVAEFNGRLTLRSKDEDHGLLALAAAGPVDMLPDVSYSGSSPSQGLQAVLNAIQGDSLKDKSVVIAATFDAAGEAQSWAPRRMKDAADGFWKYKPLTRAQFAAVGKLTFGKSAASSITSVRYDFYRLRVTS